jgi:hypothetical protein
MSSNIKIKRSEVSGNPSTLGAGELAYSALADNGSNGGDRLYIGTGVETAGDAVNHVVIGGKFFTDMITAATSSGTADTLVLRDPSGDFSSNVISAASFVGPLTGNASTVTSWATARNLGLTGDGTATLSSVNGTANVSAALTLATVNSNVGEFGSSTSIPVFTVNAKGLISGVTTAGISTSFNVYGDSGVTAVGGGGSFEIVGGTGVTTVASSGPRVTVAIGQAVAPTSNVTFNDVTVNGTLSSNDITSSAISITGDATITGNLTVSGTTTTINSTTLAIGDINIVLAKDAVNAASANGAGITINGPSTAATLTYTSTDDRWNLNKDLNVSNVYGALKGNADTATKWATARNLSLTGDATATLSSVDGSAAVSAALTLATVNSNVGSFGNSTTVPNFTVNAKGLVTAAGSTAIPSATYTTLGLASFDTDQFTVTAGAISVKAVDGGTY